MCHPTILHSSVFFTAGPLSSRNAQSFTTSHHHQYYEMDTCFMLISKFFIAITIVILIFVILSLSFYHSSSIYDIKIRWFY